MSGNYDYPPASSRRPSRTSGDSIRRRLSRLVERFGAGQSVETTHSQNSSTIAQTEPDSDLDAFLANFDFDTVPPDFGPGSQTAEQELHEITSHHLNDGILRATRPPSPRPPGERLAYLRNLIESSAHRSNAEDTTRALETLNQELEHYDIDHIRDRSNFEQARATVQRQIEQLRSELSSQRDSEGIQSNQTSSRPLTPVPPTGNLRIYPQRIYPPPIRRHQPRAEIRRFSQLSETRPVIPIIPPPPPMPQQPQLDRSGRGRPKRRKLDSDDHREGIRGFNYGQYGQVVPGALQMEIASCDGGIYDPDGDSSFPENILQNDQSVYCTKSDRCNLVLRHRGEAPFCLKKIVVKAPRVGFDSPIQEGMVFVSMSSDELLARTAQYQIQYANSRRRRRNRRPGLQPSQEYLTAFRSPLRSLERTVLMGPDSNNALEDEHSERPNEPQAEFQVTTNYEDSDDSVFIDRADDDRPSVAEVERIPDEDDICSDSEDSVSEDEDLDDSNMGNFHHRRAEMLRRTRSLRRLNSDPPSRRLQVPDLINPIPAPASTANGGPTQEVLKPHARFFIEREKSMVSIKFDPPPSGRFILIKLWSPRPDGNIDIQSIIAHGYAGPRFFPSGAFR